MTEVYYALYQVESRWGYAVGIFEESTEEPLAFYTAGDCWLESQGYYAPPECRLSHKELAAFARQTAAEMLAELNLSGKIRSSKCLIEKEVIVTAFSWGEEHKDTVYLTQYEEAGK